MAVALSLRFGQIKVVGAVAVVAGQRITAVVEHIVVEPEPFATAVNRSSISLNK